LIRSNVTAGSQILNLGHPNLTTPTFMGYFVMQWLVHVNDVIFHGYANTKFLSLTVPMNRSGFQKLENG